MPFDQGLCRGDMATKSIVLIDDEMLVRVTRFSRSLRGMTLKACNHPVPFWADLLSSQYTDAGDIRETQRR